MLITLLILQGCLPKEDKHGVASDVSYSYYLNLYADNFTTATVGVGATNGPVAFCGTTTRMGGGCNQLYGKDLQTKITKISFTKDAMPPPDDRFIVPEEVKVTNQITATVDFVFQHDNNAYTCKVEEIIFGTVKEFDIDENCTDKPSIYIAAIYSEQKDLVANLRCTLSSGGSKKSIQIMTNNVIHRHGYIALPNSGTDPVGVECVLRHDGKDSRVSKSSKDNPNLRNVCVKLKDDKKLSINHTNQDCAILFSFEDSNRFPDLANHKNTKNTTYTSKADDSTVLKDIKVVSSIDNSNIECTLSCKKQIVAGRITVPITVETNSNNMMDYFSVGNFCNTKDDYENKTLNELAKGASINCGNPDKNLTLTPDIIKNKELCVSATDVTANASCREGVGKILFRVAN